MEITSHCPPDIPRPPRAEIDRVYHDLANAMSVAPRDADGQRVMRRDSLQERLTSGGHTLAAVEWAMYLFCEQRLLRATSLKDKQVGMIRPDVCETIPRTVDVPAIAATDEFWGRWEGGSFSARQKEVILLVHGIRTFAGWQPMVQRVLEEIPNTKVVPLKYGYLDALRFWFPVLTRKPAIDDVRREIQNARAANPDAVVSVIAHSFGTYAISRILVENPDISLHRVILSGSIIPRSYRWDYVRGRIATHVVNDYGTRDIWPVLATCLSWGYGDTGRHGFGRTDVTDRGHNYAHSEFFNEKFVRDYWKPWFERDKFVPSRWEEKAPPPSWFLSILSVVPLQWIFCLLVLAGFIWIGIIAVRRLPPGTTTNNSQNVGSHDQEVRAGELPSDESVLRYYVKELPVVQDADATRIIADAFRSWEDVTAIGGIEVPREADATVVFELGPLPFVAVERPDNPKGVWRVRLSSLEQYDRTRLEAAACHAFGRVLGLGYSDDPADVMFDYDSDPTARRAVKPSAHDIREIQTRNSR